MKLNLLVIRSNNINELSKFYSKLGIEFEYHKHGNGPYHYSGKLGNIIFEIYPLSKGQEIPDKFLRIGFEVNNLEEFIKKMENVEIVKPPTQSQFGQYAVIKDIEGRKIEITQKQIKN